MKNYKQKWMGLLTTSLVLSAISPLSAGAQSLFNNPNSIAPSVGAALADVCNASTAQIANQVRADFNVGRMQAIANEIVMGNGGLSSSEWNSLQSARATAPHEVGDALMARKGNAIAGQHYTREDNGPNDTYARFVNDGADWKESITFYKDVDVSALLGRNPNDPYIEVGRFYKGNLDKLDPTLYPGMSNVLVIGAYDVATRSPSLVIGFTDKNGNRQLATAQAFYHYLERQISRSDTCNPPAKDDGSNGAGAMASNSTAPKAQLAEESHLQSTRGAASAPSAAGL